MNRRTIMRVRTLCEEVIHACDDALKQLDVELEQRNEWAAQYSPQDVPVLPSPGDYSYGSKATGSLRRKSMDLTRALSEMRKPC